jgi:hypothetical protein
VRLRGGGGEGRISPLDRRISPLDRRISPLDREGEIEKERGKEKRAEIAKIRIFLRCFYPYT